MKTALTVALAFALGWTCCVLLAALQAPSDCPFTPWLAFVSGAPLWGAFGAFVIVFVQACAAHSPTHSGTAASASMTPVITEPLADTRRVKPTKRGEGK